MRKGVRLRIQVSYLQDQSDEVLGDEVRTAMVLAEAKRDLTEKIRGRLGAHTTVTKCEVELAVVDESQVRQS